MMFAYSSRQNKQDGFTIIELLIATSVFAVILLIVTAGVMAFTRSYYKGVTLSATQATARGILNSASQAIQFSSSETGFRETRQPGPPGFCVNDKMFSYVLNRQLTSGTPTADQTRHALIVSEMPACSAATTALDVTAPMSMTDKNELLSEHMRLSDLTITEVGNPSDKAYAVTVVVAYGDSDLLDLTDPKRPHCKTVEGSQFCAVSSLSTIVKQRL